MHKIISDPDAATYLPFAKSRLEHLKRDSGLFWTNTCVIDGYAITVSRSGDQESISITRNGNCNGWYMDSCLCGLIATAKKAVKRGVSGKWHFGTKLLNSLTNAPMWGDINPTKHVNKTSGYPPSEDGVMKVGALTKILPALPAPLFGVIGIKMPVGVPINSDADLQAWVIGIDETDPKQLDAWLDLNGCGEIRPGADATMSAIKAIEDFAYGSQNVTQQAIIDLQGWSDARMEAKNALATKKRAIQMLPSSMFHGKLRLWVQAIYGKKFVASEWVDWSDAGGIPEIPKGTTHYWASPGVVPLLSIALPGLGANGLKSSYGIAGNNTVLYTDDTYHYWLIEISSDSTKVIIRPLNLSPCGEVARLFLLTNNGIKLPREDKARYESVMLQTAQPDLINYFTMQTGIPKQERGQAFAYGWKSNWDGSKADIITQGGGVGPTGYDVGDFWQVGYHLSLTFNRNTRMALSADQTESDRWTVSGNSSVGANWQYNADFDTIWTPQYDNGDLSLRLPIPLRVNNIYRPIAITGTAPIYCFYGADDKLKIITFAGDVNKALVEATGQPNDCFDSGSPNYTRPAAAYAMLNLRGFSYDYEKHTYTSRVYGGFLCADPVVDTRKYNSSSSMTREKLNLTLSYTDAYDIFINPAPPANLEGLPSTSYGGNCWQAIRSDNNAYLVDRAQFYVDAGNNGGHQTWTVGKSSGSYLTAAGASRTQTGYSSAVIPYGDCEAIYLCSSASELRNYSTMNYTEYAKSVAGESAVTPSGPWCTAKFPNAGTTYLIQMGGAPGAGSNSLISSPPPEKSSLPSVCVMVGKAGIQQADSAFFNKLNDVPDGSHLAPGSIMAPVNNHLVNHSADTFFTITGAVYCDAIGKTFTTGGYQTPKGMVSNFGFIGFA